MTNKIPFILASSSPRRKELLGHLKIPFTIQTKHVDEVSHETDPVKFVADIATQKGEIVAKGLELDQAIIISADTIVVFAGKIYGKPNDKEDARKILNELAGQTHSVFTAVNIIWKKGDSFLKHCFVEESKVTFNTIPDYLMDIYIATGDSLDKAGAYGIQGASLSFISKVEGDYANVVGFPLSRFVNEIEKFLGSKLWLEQF